MLRRRDSRWWVPRAFQAVSPAAHAHQHRHGAARPPSGRPIRGRLRVRAVGLSISRDGSQPPRERGSSLAMAQQKPLIYFHGIVPGRYLAIWPAFVTGDDRRHLSFQVAFEPGDTARLPELAFEEEAQRSYAFRVVKQRLHQAGFRERVLVAYLRTCSLCRLRHEELLDAAHIIPDGQPRGDPVIPQRYCVVQIASRSLRYQHHRNPA